MFSVNLRIWTYWSEEISIETDDILWVCSGVYIELAREAVKFKAKANKQNLWPSMRLSITPDEIKIKTKVKTKPKLKP